jgi:HD-GYP domain-containing protein (c-di-GMP phosphodiesterase class II)/MFS family permease
LYLGIGSQLAALLPIRWKNGVQYVIAPPLIAAGLLSPGGVVLLCWLATFDGRLPGRDIRLWQFLFNRSLFALAYGLPAIALLRFPNLGSWTIPTETLVYGVAMFLINYGLMTIGVALHYRQSIVDVIRQNVDVATVRSTLVLAFAGGILFALLQDPRGYLLAPGLFGFLIAVRGNVADAQRQSEARKQTLELAAQALDARDRYTESHSARVADMAVRLGIQLGLTGRQREQIHTAGSLHDIGKIGVRDHILNKRGPLTDEEWAIMRKHPDIGADLVARHSALAPLAPIVRHHHERWDGSGYPGRLIGEEIPVGSRILAVADSFDTITTPRLYRRDVLSAEDAVDDITRRSGTWYDPTIVDALRSVYGLPKLAPSVDHDARPFRSLGAFNLLRTNPRFRQLVLGMSISSIGDPLTLVATLVSVYGVTGNAGIAGAVFALQAATTIATSVFMGGLTDRVRRKSLIVQLEVARAGILLITPLLLSVTFWLIVPIIVAMAVANTIVQPARQAAIPETVDAKDVGRANSVLTACTMLASALAFPIAGVVLVLGAPPTWLFPVDGMTFLIAGLLTLRAGDLGGGVPHIPLSGAIRVAWSLRHIRAYLVVMAAAALLLSISYPALVALAYAISAHGAQAYTLLQFALFSGVVLGSIIVGRLKAIGSMRTVSVGLGLTGIFAIVIALSPTPWLVALALVVASIGNSLYTVANQTALLEGGTTENRGSIMTARFGIGQTVVVVGAALGGLLTSRFGPQAAYLALGGGLLLLALSAAALARFRASAAADGLSLGVGRASLGGSGQAEATRPAATLHS